ncbi:hypothetical protein [Niallia sp. 01092]|uniref:hypothetical protein n=1 Tax=unclassified Niallia TaxID=2837522 RepID=UPI003FCFE9AA
MNNTLESNIYLIKNNLVKQMRSYSFLLVIGISLFLGYACVPSLSSGYEVFYIGGVRGIYNSAWLGGMAAMLSTLLLWLFGFYMLRSQILEDQRLKVGQIIASTPISNFRYVSSKVISNFFVLVVMELMMILAFMSMQLLRGEEYQLEVWDYFAPFLFIALPSLFVLAALSVFFDVFPGVKGVIGNIIFFGLWIFFSVISIASPNSFWDVYGLDVIRSDMVQEAAMKYDFIADSQEGGSFGYYPVEGKISTFEWQGVDWNPRLLTLRVIWVFIAGIIILLSSIVFDRFKNQGKGKQSGKLSIFETNKKLLVKSNLIQSFRLSPVEKEKRIHLSRLVKVELLIMIKGFSIWWYLFVIGVIAASLLISLDKIRSWLPLVMVLPIAIWSQMGNREKHYFMREIILSSCPPLYKFIAVWISGVLIALLMSLGVLIHFLMEGQLLFLHSWITGIFFIPTLGLALGSFSGSRKLFEVIYMLWWYLGPVNNMPYLDFLGVSTGYPNFYAILTVILLSIAIVVQQLQAGNHRIIGAKRTIKHKGAYNEKFKQ